MKGENSIPALRINELTGFFIPTLNIFFALMQMQHIQYIFNHHYLFRSLSQPYSILTHSRAKNLPGTLTSDSGHPCGMCSFTTAMQVCYSCLCVRACVRSQQECL